MPIKILMVCLGNICRSPIAEGIMSSKLPKDTFIVDSCAIGNWHIGKQPDSRSILVSKKNGLDISKANFRLQDKTWNFYSDKGSLSHSPE